MGVEMDPTLLSEVVNPWLLGADPEFAVLEPPDKLVANAGENYVEFDCVAGDIGYDHGGRVWEVRPAPSYSAYGVTTNIWKLLRRSELERVEHFKWKGGALGARKGPNDLHVLLGHHPLAAPAPAPAYDTLGGHVHFGIAQFNAAQRAALDSITTALLNLDILPAKENLTRVKTSSYGHFSGDAVRQCNGHVEYRSAPSWLDKPGQAFAALTTYKLAGARPSTTDWTTHHTLRNDFQHWLSEFAKVDVDAFLLDRLIERRGFDFIQADPDSDFRPRWRKEELWAK